jgi:predicted acyl esterase
VRRYRGSVLLVQGLQDWNVNPGQQWPLVERLEARGVHVKYMLGQWGHSYPDQQEAPDRRDDWADILLAWYDRWLKGDRGAPIAPRVHVEDNEGTWRTERSWPPRGRRARLWLGDDDALHAKRAGDEGSRTLAPDPAHTQGAYTTTETPAECATPGCAAFSTEPFARRTRVTGLPRLDLTVTPSGPVGHVSAYLYAVGEDGEATRIGWTQADLRFPRGDDERRAVTPGEPTTMSFPFQPLDAVVPAGARLVLVLGQGTAYNRTPSTPPAPVELGVGGRQSSIALTQSR